MRCKRNRNPSIRRRIRARSGIYFNVNVELVFQCFTHTRATLSLALHSYEAMPRVAVNTEALVTIEALLRL